jgi:prepilin-type N-terminal cleavage/methylation domain-containing protein
MTLSFSKTGSRVREGGRHGSGAGFTLLEVLVALVVLAVGVAVTMSVISSSLGNVRKSQVRTRLMAFAQTVMESALSKDDLQPPASYQQELPDGFHCTVTVEEEPDANLQTQTVSELPIKLLHYTVQLIGPDSESLYALETLKLVAANEAQP